MNGYRCSTCGSLRRAREVVPGEGHQGIACREHPDSPVVAWDRRHQWALHYIDVIAGMLELGVLETPLLEWAETYSLDEFPGVPRDVMAVVAVLYTRWGGIPERALPERSDEQKRAELQALYGSTR